MKYSDGNEAHLGDRIRIDDKYFGEVVSCMDCDEYSASHPREHWEYLGKGIMVNTDFGGLVHFSDDSSELMVLLSRATTAG